MSNGTLKRDKGGNLLGKVCGKCHEYKTEEHYRRQRFKHSPGREYLVSYCTPCREAYRKETVKRDNVKKLEWYHKNKISRGIKEDQRRRRKKYYLSLSVEEKQDLNKKSADSKRQWVDRNREAVNAGAREKYWANIDESRNYNRIAALKRASRMAGGDEITMEFIESIKEAQEYKCLYCGISIVENKYHIDHYIPLAKGGKHSKNNLVIACDPCNRRKSAIMPWVFDNKINQVSLSL